MMHEVHLKASAVRTATELWKIITEALKDIEGNDA